MQLSVRLVLLVVFAMFATAGLSQDRIENWVGKTIMVVTPHPDDDLFGCGGTMALLARHKNHIVIVIYTNDNKGSYDQEMTSERLARIRKAEEEAASETLGILKQDIVWLGYDDGELEYAPPKQLCGQITQLIRKYRPDALFSVDPGERYERWHKTDHRMAAFNTIDAVRAAEFHLYYPEHLLYEGLQPYQVPELFFYYTLKDEANYWINIDEVIDLKIEAAAKHVSQFEPSVSRYRPDWDPAEYKKFVTDFKIHVPQKEKHYVESFRRATGFNQE
jgi:LmbE family N-acetylglucosaminyl deacetylase